MTRQTIRSLFAPAGKRLPPDQFAKSVAGATFSSTSEEAVSSFALVEWNSPGDLHPPFRLEELRRAAARWDSFLERRVPFHIEVRSDGPIDALIWVAHLLRHPAVGAASVFIGSAAATRGIDWQYPVRIGMTTASLRTDYDDAARNYPTLCSLSEPVAVPEERGAVDVLLFDSDLTTAFDTVSRSPHAIHAHMVAITGGSGNATKANQERWRSRLQELLCAQVFLETEQRATGAFLNKLLEELAHDNPLDVAAARAANASDSSQPYLLFATRGSLVDSRVGNAADTLIQRYKDADSKLPLAIGPHAASRLGLGGDLFPIPVVLNVLERRISNIGWLHEYDGAEVIAAVRRALSKTSQKAIADEPTVLFRRDNEVEPPVRDRHLQASVLAESGTAEWQTTDCFLTNRAHQIEVHIGPIVKARASLVLPEPILGIPGGHLLTVTFFEPRLMAKSQVQSIFLPNDGASDRCRFHVPAAREPGNFDGTLLVLHENRVIEAATIRGPIVTSEDNPRIPIQFERHASLRAIADLSERSRFDGAFIIHSSAGGAAVQAVSGNDGRHILVSNSTVQAAQKRIWEILDQGLWDLQEMNVLSSDEVANVFRELAVHGGRIYAHLKSRNRLQPAVLNARRLQVVPATPDSRFPVEFIYARNPPARDAPVCAHAAEGLRSGKCTAQCDPLDRTPAPFICPLGFWGLNRVIEWHTASEQRQLPAHAAVRLDDFGAASKTGVTFIDGRPLFGYSRKIDDADADCIPAFKQHYDLAHAQTWPEWKTYVEELSPGILILMVHTQVEDPYVMLEMGPADNVADQRDNDPLSIDDLTQDHIYGPKTKGTPLVLLLGCTTGRADFAFDSVVAAVEDRCSAGIVVSTTNLIYGPKAVKIAEMFLEKLAAVRDGDSFGEVLLNIRRELLADGMCMVLCLNASGDADWKLVREAAFTA
jgi:hypothetical protein